MRYCVLSLFLLVAACTTTSRVISADENHIAVVPPNDVIYEMDRPAAAAEEAQAHCQQYGKNAVLRDTQMSGGVNPSVVSVYFDCVVPSQTPSSKVSSSGEFLAWYCYGMYSEMKSGGDNYVFYAYSDADLAYVGVHGEEVPAKFSMDGLDALYLFGSDAERGRYDYFLSIKPDGDARYGDYRPDLLIGKSSYYCRKAKKSR